MNSVTPFKVYDFTKLDLSDREYESGSMDKLGVLIENQPYLLKFQGITEYPIVDSYGNRDFYSTYASYVISEYISCNFIKFALEHIYNNNLLKKQFNYNHEKPISVQEVKIGYSNDLEETDKNVLTVACKDFRSENERLVLFKTLINKINVIEKRNSQNKLKGNRLEDVLYVINKQKYVDKQRLFNFFCFQLIMDSYIGNFDRNENNWGFIVSESNKYRIAPIFDCGSSLHPKTPRSVVTKYVQGYNLDESEADSNVIFKRSIQYPHSHFKIESIDNKQHIRLPYHGFHQMLQSEQYVDCNGILFKNPFSKIELIQIKNMFVEIYPAIQMAHQKTMLLLEEMEEHGVLPTPRKVLLKEELYMKMKKLFAPSYESIKRSMQISNVLKVQKQTMKP